MGPLPIPYGLSAGRLLCLPPLFALFYCLRSFFWLHPRRRTVLALAFIAGLVLTLAMRWEHVLGILAAIAAASPLVGYNQEKPFK